MSFFRILSKILIPFLLYPECRKGWPYHKFMIHCFKFSTSKKWGELKKKLEMNQTGEISMNTGVTFSTVDFPVLQSDQKPLTHQSASGKLSSVTTVAKHDQPNELTVSHSTHNNSRINSRILHLSDFLGRGRILLYSCGKLWSHSGVQADHKFTWPSCLSLLIAEVAYVYHDAWWGRWFFKQLLEENCRAIMPFFRFTR